MKIELLSNGSVSEVREFGADAEVVIGRGRDCALRIPDTESSRHHSRIVTRNGRVFLSDLGSTNGTLVNGRRVSEAPLANGDEIQIGQTVMRVSGLPGADVQGTTMLQMSDRKRSVVLSIDHREADILSAEMSTASSKEMVHENEILRELCQISQLVAAETDEQTVLVSVLDLLHTRLEASTACILRRCGPDAEWDMVATSQATGSAAEIHVSQTLIDQAVKEGQAIISSDPLSDHRFSPSQSIVIHKISSALCSPLKVGGTFCGVLSIDRRQKRQVFDAMDLRLAASAANMLSLFMEKQQYERAAREKARLAVIGEVIAGLAHYIKNVVTGFRLSIDGLRMAMERKKFDSAEGFVNSISTQEARISELMLNMLSYAKDRTPVRENIKIKSLLESVVAPYRAQFDEDHILFQIKCDDDVPDVHAEELSLHRAFLNLLTNAIDVLRSMAPGHERLLRVTIRTLEEGKVVSIRIYDTGGGIPQDKVARIFEAFYSTKGSGGTGLGLAVVHKVVTEHRGSISVESEEGRWTAFTLTLPAAPTAGEAGKPATEETKAPVLRLKTVQ